MENPTFTPTHPWNLSPKQAISLQKELAREVKLRKLAQKPRYIAGLDCAFAKDKGLCFAACVLWNMMQQTAVEEHAISCKSLDFTLI